MAASLSLTLVATAAILILAVVTSVHSARRGDVGEDHTTTLRLNTVGKNVQTKKSWCVPRSTASDSALRMAMDIACQNGADCKRIKKGGQCFTGKLYDHATYVMNSYYAKNDRHENACDFNGVGRRTKKDPSHGSCKFP